ncbi:mrpl50p [Saccharomyces arboricola H-6]|uniref:Mrpl50p n=1 Tax=Saccharomyces arboricola (strain H-6 / AS 2.3317 / CBS 10644) TaxID=1160507 RepID=J8LIL7_SACAR|nr:mrpl50p [Saccharomyces arboricola H-6]
MFRSTHVCLSALTKRTHRVKVQVLRDFPRFQLLKGQVTKVKPSLMRNYLHNFNGAKYIINEEHDVNVELLKLYQARELKLEEDRQLHSKHQEMETQRRNESQKQSVFGQKKEKSSKEDKNGLLDSGITIEEVKIPGLDI